MHVFWFHVPANAVIVGQNETADPASAKIAGVVQEALRLQAEAIGAESLLRKDRIAIFQ